MDDPTLAALPAATAGPLHRDSFRCGDSGTDTGPWRQFERLDGSTGTLVASLARRAKRVGWTETRPIPPALNWAGERRLGGAAAKLSILVDGNRVEVGIDASCTQH